MEGELVTLITGGGDTAVLIVMMGIGFHKLSMRLQAIESHLAAKRELNREQDKD